jgi:hypothetical protein
MWIAATKQLLKYTARPSKRSSAAHDGRKAAHLRGKPEVHGLNRVTPGRDEVDHLGPVQHDDLPTVREQDRHTPTAITIEVGHLTGCRKRPKLAAWTRRARDLSITRGSLCTSTGCR